MNNSKSNLTKFNTNLIKLNGYLYELDCLEKGESLELQKKEIKSYVKSKGWKLFNIYEDAGISGFRAESRPSFQNMIKDADTEIV